MMLRAIIIFLAATSAQAEPFLELGAGYNANLFGCDDCWDDGGAGPLGAYMRIGAQYDWRGVTIGGHWIHLSQWLVGPPWNDDAESSVDHVGVFARFRLD